MTLLAAALLAATQPVGPPAPLPETEEGRAAQCQVAARRNPQAALANANRWRAAGGGLHARQCIGLAYVELEQWRPAATTFEQAAQEADRNGEARGADFWVQAGNAWLAGGDPVRAVVALDTALKSRHLTPALRGEVRLDRARALVAQNKLAEARTDLDTALQLVPADPMAWYLSAELARRQKDLPRARADINRALEIARENPEALLLAGTIAGQAGDMAEAERLYRQVAERAPNTDAGRAARASLGMIAQNGAATPPPPPPAAPQRN
ncbi:MAG TPA: tetratricopeptide repeat protein [Allosphingosinicella sp.]|nr:tetratricopeptide repeat protein [Allosphingosinicella sp.]